MHTDKTKKGPYFALVYHAISLNSFMSNLGLGCITAIQLLFSHDILIPSREICWSLIAFMNFKKLYGRDFSMKLCHNYWYCFLNPNFVLFVFFHAVGGRLEQELEYTEATLGTGWGATSQIIVQTPKNSGENILTQSALLQHVRSAVLATQVEVDMYGV